MTVRVSFRDVACTGDDGDDLDLVRELFREYAPPLDLYRKLGFVEIPPYYSNPLPGAVYLEPALKQARFFARNNG